MTRDENKKNPSSEIDPSQSNGNHAHAPQQAPRISTDANAGTGRMLAIGVIILAIVLVIAFGISLMVRLADEKKARQSATLTADSKPVVDVVFAQPSEKSYPLLLPGQTSGWDQSPIFAQVSGYVAAWLVDIGDHVTQGQVLARIDTPETDQQLKASQAKASASAAQVEVAQSSVSIARLTYDRWRDSPKGVVSEQERDEKKAAYDEALAKLTAAKAQYMLDEADVSRYQAMEGFKDLTAPYTGIITARHVDIGNLVTAGSSENTRPLYNMARFETIRVFVDVPQKAAAEMIIGLPADASSDQYPGRIFHGKIARTAMSMDPQTRTQRTEVDIENKDLTLVPNMYVQVTFQLNQAGLQEVPAAAILFRPGGLQVAVITSDNKVEFRHVTVAKDNGDVVILATGINAGDRVALNLSSAITAGEEVQVNQETQSTDTPAAPPPTPKNLKLQTTAPVAHVPISSPGIPPEG